MRKIKALLLSCVMLVMMSNVSCTTKEEEPVKGVESSINETGQVKAVKITAPKANVTLGCDPNSQVLQTANKGANFKVLNQVNDQWYAVQLPNNQIGFIPKGQSTPVTPGNNNAPAGAPSGAGAPGAGKVPGGGNVPSGGGAPGTGTPGTGTPGAGTPGAGTPAPAPNAPDNTTPENNQNTGDNAANSEKNTTTNQGINNQEQQMINLVNQSRQQNGLPALKADNQLSEIARIKSKDMIDKNYFSHNSPTYGSPFDMLKNFGVSYIKAGENIAGNQTVEKAHEALMNSPGHRANILNSEYTHIGIGIQKGGNYGNMFTQIFIRK